MVKNVRSNSKTQAMIREMGARSKEPRFERLSRTNQSMLDCNVEMRLIHASMARYFFGGGGKNRN